MLSLVSARFPVARLSASSQIRVRVRVPPSPNPLFLKLGVSSPNHSPDRMEISTEASPRPSETENGEETQKSEENVVQYVVLRRDLIDTWPLGSVVTQGCHASVSAIWANKDDVHTVSYCSPDKIDSMHKVTLEVKTEAQLLSLSEKLKAADVAHKLWIEQPENVPTCLATKPYPKAAVSSFFKKLKLCEPHTISQGSSSQQQGQQPPPCFLPRGASLQGYPPPPPGYFPFYPQGVSQGFYPPQLYHQPRGSSPSPSPSPSRSRATRANIAAATNKSRNQHFSVEEDTALCNCWMKACEDKRTTTSQTGQGFWIRIFNEFKSQIPATDRTFDSVRSRWTHVKKTVGVFCGILREVDESVTTFSDRVNAARAAYYTKYSSAFALEHCFLLLKDHPKWDKQYGGEKRGKKRNNGGNIPIDEEFNTTPMDPADFDPTEEASMKRHKKESQDVVNLLKEEDISNESNASRDADLHLRMMEIESRNKRTEAKLKKNRVLVRSEEVKIMTTDTLLFDDELKRLWKFRQDRIKGRWAVGNYDGSDEEEGH